MSQLRQLIYNLNVVFEPTGSDYFPCFSIPLSLGYLVVLLSHMHVPGCIGGVLLAAVVKARKVLGKLLSASSHMLFPLVIPLDLISHSDVLDKVVHQLLSFFLVTDLGHIEVVDLPV